MAISGLENQSFARKGRARWQELGFPLRHVLEEQAWLSALEYLGNRGLQKVPWAFLG